MSDTVNISTVTFTGHERETNVYNALYRYDYGQIVVVEGLDLPQAFDVHICNVGDETTERYIGINNTINIPNKFLNSGEDITIYLYLHDTASDGRTVYIINIPVRDRGEPQDVEIPQEDQDLITQAIVALDDAVEQTAADAARAEAAAELAEGYAADAAGSVDDVRAYAEAAAASATEAEGYKDDAVAAKNRSEEILVSVAALDESAEGHEYWSRIYAEAANNSANDATTAAGTATSKAGEAEVSATLAGNKADAADASSLKAEGYAVGKQNGVPVSGGEYYHNNSQYYSEQAAASAEGASGSASSAAADALASEGYAVGTQNGREALPDSPYYHNNSKYYEMLANDHAVVATDKASEAWDSAASAGASKDAAVAAKSEAVSARDEAVSAGADAVSASAYAVAAKNLAIEAKNAAAAAKTAAEAARDAAEDAKDAAEIAASSISGSAAQIDQNTEDIAQLKSDIGSFVVTSLPLDAAEGQIAISISTGHPIPHMFLNGAWASMLLFDKPVGYIYISASAEDPGELYGGTWARIAGRFLLGATDGGSSGAEQAAGNTGGLAVVTLDASQIPAHTHGEETLTGYTHIKRHGTSGSGTTIVGSNSGIVSTESETWTGSHSLVNASARTLSNPLWDKLTVDATHEHDSVGGGQPHENMPPYLAVYMWQRTA